MAQNEYESRTRENTTTYQQSIQKEVDAVMLEAERKKRRRDLDRQIQTLAERAIVFEDQYGINDYRTQIMTIFLEVTLQMKSAIDLLNDVGVALQCIGQAIGCIDDVLNLQQEILDSSLEQRYGFFERMKRRRKIRRAMRNNAARMQQMADMLVGSQKMAMSVVSALRKSCVRMQATAEKNFAKQNKREEKLRAAGKADNQPSLAKKLMDDLRAKDGNGGSAPTANGGGSSGPAPSAPSNSDTGSSQGGSTSSDISDII